MMMGVIGDGWVVLVVEKFLFIIIITIFFFLGGKGGVGGLMVMESWV